MIKNLIKALLAFYLTIYYGIGSGIFPYKHMGNAAFPSEPWLASSIEFLLWFLTFWLVIYFILSALAFATAGGIGRYNSTKIGRIVQGISAEVFMVSLIFLVILLGVNASDLAGKSQNSIDKINEKKAEADRQYETELQQHKKNVVTANSLDKKIEQEEKDLKVLKETRKRDAAYWTSDAMKWKMEFGLSEFEKYYDIDLLANDILACLEKFPNATYSSSVAISDKCREVLVFYTKYDHFKYIFEYPHAPYWDQNIVNRKTGKFLGKRSEELYASKFIKEYIALINKITEAERLIKAEKSRFHELGISIPPSIISYDDFHVEKSPYWETFIPTFNERRGIILFFALVFWLVNRFAFRESFSTIYTLIIRFWDESSMGFGGTARFASMFEEWGKSYEKGALYMGRSLYSPFHEIGIKDDAHMITVAPSRAGKGTAAIIPNLLLWQGSSVVIDPKGTNAAVTAQARRDMGHDVYIVDPFGIVVDKSDRFNPFEHLDKNDKLVREKIASIADALVIPDDHSKDPHWDDGARTIIAGLISQVLTEKNKPELSMVRGMISALPEEQDLMWATMSQNTGAGGYAKDAANRVIRGAETNEILSLLSNADKHTEWLSSKVMQSVTADSTFSISDIKKKPTTIYLVIPPRQLKRHRRLLRLFINLVIDTMEHGGRSDIPVLMMMDEFLALGKMPEIEDAFATMASYNLILWPFIQDLARLQKMYGESFNAFIANSRALQVFGVTDSVTTKYVSERLGKRPIKSLTDIASAHQSFPLRSPEDVEKDLSKEYGRQYIFESGKPPLLIEKVPYYDSAPIKFARDILKGRFHGKYAPDPDFK